MLPMVVVTIDHQKYRNVVDVVLDSHDHEAVKNLDIALYYLDSGGHACLYIHDYSMIYWWNPLKSTPLMESNPHAIVLFEM